MGVEAEHDDTGLVCMLLATRMQRLRIAVGGTRSF